MSHSYHPLRFAKQRRNALRALAALLLAPATPAVAQAPLLAPTPSQPEGPFYPRTLPAERDADLTRVAGRTARASGTPLYFSGRVLARDSRPLVGASVELWQCDVYGRYHNAGDEGSPRDDGFQGYGVVKTDAEGRYAFTTIRPVPYSGRTPHLHVRVRAGGTALTTQIYIAGDSADGDFVLAATPREAKERLTIALAPAIGREQGALSGNFDFVLA
ncbi:MAG TPA: intradiol ring-cleavage dioxygenase [Casimicrobiaceae bacterium]|nr:intradiol ring-cleavage dioxygenase [Casimicrobiaceae bacterium]